MLPDGTVVRADIGLEDGRIASIGDDIDAGHDAVDVRGALIVPGFVDTHVHGALGRNFMMDDEEATEAIGEFLVAHGVTSALMATASVPRSQTLSSLQGLAPQVGRRDSGLDILGIHLEGPFLSRQYRGVHRLDAVRDPSLEEVTALLSALAPALRVVTLAPELEGAVEATRVLRAHDVVVSMGHSGGAAAHAAAVIDAGADRATHVLNAMPQRHNGSLVDEIFSHDEVIVELIADGHHVPAAAIRSLYRELGPDRIAVVSDGADVTGLADGPHRRWEGTDIVLAFGTSRTPEGMLAGSVSPLDQSLRYLVHEVGLPLSDVVRSLTLTPARSIRAHAKGRLSLGADADLIVLDDDLQLLTTIADGRLVHTPLR
jgi:N-acetylglucosamine-6-phosphate deacetylase